jgi:UDP-glucose 4-epimerase
MSRRAVVTGGAGFVGSHVADAFLQYNYEVLALDDLSTGHERNLPEAAGFERLDIVDFERLEGVISSFRPDVVCHLAAQSSVTLSVREPRRDLTVNVKGTLNVCEAARAVGAQVVFASTGGALYGDRAGVPTSEEATPEPLAPYGASKLSGEAYVATWGRLHGLPNVVLRLGNVYGPRQDAHGEAGVVAIFSDRLLAGETPTVFGDGTQTRDYVHVRDVASAFLLTAAAGRAGTYNVGTGVEHSVLELLELLQRAAGVSVEPRFEPLRPGELTRSALDGTRLQQDTGWQADTTLEAGLRETFDWYAQSRAPAAPEVATR